MTDDRHDSGSVPGSDAGDAAPTQHIPRIDRPKASTATKTAPAKKATRPAGRPSRSVESDAEAAAPARPEKAVGEQARPSVAHPIEIKEPESVNGAQTDKGRVRETPPPPQRPEAPAAGPSPDEKHPAAAAPTVARDASPAREKGTSPSRPLTAADYARTTTTSPDATAVIPAVKEAPAEPAKKPAVTVKPSGDAGGGRRASLRLARIEPWSVTRLAFTVSVAMMIVAVVAVTIFWYVLDAAGVWDQVNESVTTVLSDDSTSFDITDYLGFGRMFGLTLVLSAINVVLMTALATIAAHLYNLAAQLLGGVEVTFAEQK